MKAFFPAMMAVGFAGCGTSGSNFSGDAGGRDSAVDGRIIDGNSDRDALTLSEASMRDSGSALRCSGDLQSVIGPTGTVVQVCPPDEGCAGGKCIPACDAAAANHGTLGCDFWVARPSADPTMFPACFAMFLANGWPKAATVEISRDGTTYDATTFGRIASGTTAPVSWSGIPVSGVPSGSVGILFLSQDPKATNDVNVPIPCPVTPALYESGGGAVFSHIIPATGIGTAWHVVTDVPVTAYDILPYGGASSYYPSAELLIPTTAWGTNYYGVVPAQGLYGSNAAQWGQVVAMVDNTVVTLLPNVTLPSGMLGGDVDAAPAGKVTRYILDAGQFIQWQDSEEMSGTVISSDQPIGYMGGIGLELYTSMTAPGGASDSAHQQIPPINALGSEYVAPPYATRMASLAPESIPYRLVGAVDGTALSYDPPVAAAPTSLSAGQAADFETTVAFRVKSQDADHPFYVGQMMTGCGVTGGSRPGCEPYDAGISDAGASDADGGGGDSGGCCLGDPEFVNILPPAQFLEKYVFFTDVTYSTTNLVFTRVKGTSGFEDVTLDCAGALSGWQAVGTEGLYEVTSIDLVRSQKPNGMCGNGPHTASSSAPFGVMVWGLDSYSSYAYPAGGNATPINHVVVSPTPK